MNLKLEARLVSVNWLYKHLDYEKLIILDGTINKDLTEQATKIPKARFLDLKNKFCKVNAAFPNTVPSKLQFEKEARNLGINHNSIIVVYDDRGIYSSARVWWLFHLFGFNNIAILDGGLPAWIENNYPVQFYQKESYALGDFSATYQPNLHISFNQLKNQNNHQIIDVRSKERFEEKVDEPRQGLRRGKITNSINLPYTNVLKNGRLKSKKELSEIFNVLKLQNKTLIFSCGSGITACIVALAADVIGFKKYKIYDGSWTEYGSLTKKDSKS